jgi:hypothetical protein
MFFIEEMVRVNIPFKFKQMNTCDVMVSGGMGILSYLPTAGRTSAMVATKSQIRPL